MYWVNFHKQYFFTRLIAYTDKDCQYFTSVETVLTFSTSFDSSLVHGISNDEKYLIF